MTRFFPLLLLPAAACSSVRGTPPSVQPSSAATADAIVTISQGASFMAPCLNISPGQTVEWRNLTPLSPIDMVSTAAPYEISAPALLSPYDEVPPSQSDECAKLAPDGVTCLEPLPYSYWRHTFLSAGVFDYFDSVGTGVTSTTTGGEYGMPVSSSTTTTPATGTVCVEGADAGSICAAVCCITGSAINQCPANTTCIAGRCGGVTLPPGGTL